jgi:hypothetical protein
LEKSLKHQESVFELAASFFKNVRNWVIMWQNNHLGIDYPNHLC